MTSVFNTTDFTLDGAKVLEILHNSVRFGNSNEFVLPIPADELVSEDFQFPTPEEFINSDEGTYYQGIIVPSIVLGVFFFLWLILLPFARCFLCKCACCSNNVKLLFFLFFLLASIIGWFASIGGNNLLQEGLEGGVDNSNSLGDNMGTASDALLSILNQRAALDQASDDAEAACSVGGIIDLTGQLPRGSDLDVLVDPQQFMEDIQGSFETTSEEAEPIIQKMSSIYTAITTCIIIFLSIFGLTTCFTVMYNRNMLKNQTKHKHCLAEMNSCINKCGCWIMFTLGLLFIVVIVVFIIMIAPIATLGADLCSPDPNENILTELAKGEGDVNFDFCAITDAFDDMNDLEKAGNVICHYSQCRGDNKVFELGDITATTETDGSVTIKIGPIEDGKAEIASARQNIETANDLDQSLNNGDNSAQIQNCNSTVDVLEALLLQVEADAISGVEVFTCNELSPLYSDVWNENTCNGIIAGLGVIFITWTLGSFGMMAAMYMYIIIEYEEVEDSMHEDYYGDATIQEAQEIKEAEPISPEEARRSLKRSPSF